MFVPGFEVFVPVYHAKTTDLLRKVTEHRSATKNVSGLGSPETTIVALTCSLYQNAIATLVQLKFDILSGLFYFSFFAFL